ncbi:hypothetical protein [Rubripirellula amarantea]|nr:hypothetical protein [Rubripirellula amarantea]
MTGNIIAAIVLLVVCVAVLRYLRRSSSDRQRGLPWIALIAGPAFAAFYVWIDYNWIQPYNYRTWDDAIHSIIPVMIVGAFGGCVGAASIWIGNRLTGQRVR